MKDYVLYVYRAPSGQISGAILYDDQEVCGIAGCASLDEIEEAAIEAGYHSYKLFIPIPL